MEVEYKKVTQKQARHIRQAITTFTESTTRIWPKRNYTYVVFLPLNYPYVKSYKGKLTLEDLKDSCMRELIEEPLIFTTGHYKHQRIIPTLEELENLKYKITGQTDQGLRTEWI